MRQLLFAAGLSAVLAVPAFGEAPPKRPQKASEAPSAVSHAAPISYRAPALGKGYTARERHMADCLASAAGYDPAIDRIRLKNGATRPCRM